VFALRSALLFRFRVDQTADVPMLTPADVQDPLPGGLGGLGVHPSAVTCFASAAERLASRSADTLTAARTV
jgi:hypothetical protein